MNKKQKKIVSVVGIIIVLLALLGVSYAYFLTRIQGNTNEKSISVTTADLKLVYNDGTDGVINFNDNTFVPGTYLGKKTFTVANEGNARVSYGLYLENIINKLTLGGLVYKVHCESNIAGNTCNGVNETDYPKFDSKIISNSIEINEVHTYTLELEYKELNIDQSDDMNKKIEGKLQIHALDNVFDIIGSVEDSNSDDILILISDNDSYTSQISNKLFKFSGVKPGLYSLKLKTSTGETDIINNINITLGTEFNISGNNLTITKYTEGVDANLNITQKTITFSNATSNLFTSAQPGTLLYAIGKNNHVTNVTTVGQSTTEGDSVMGITDDQYSETGFGTSYYFRGNVKNNFVTFGNMCFRIVRVQGDENIKLVLADENNPCGENSTIGYSTEKTDSAFVGEKKSFTRDGGLKWLDGGSVYYFENDYPTAQYTFNGVDLDKTKMVNNNWCDDVSKNNIFYYGNIQGGYIETPNKDECPNCGEYYYYNGFYRINTPSLKCDFEGAGNSKSKFNQSYVGLLTSDEMVFAGMSKETSVTYLNTNAELEYFTYNMHSDNTPGGHFGIFINNGKLSTHSASPNNSRIRPSIVLNKNVAISSGDGTQSNPYVVE